MEIVFFVFELLLGVNVGNWLIVDCSFELGFGCVKIREMLVGCWFLDVDRVCFYFGIKEFVEWCLELVEFDMKDDG